MAAYDQNFFYKNMLGWPKQRTLSVISRRKIAGSKTSTSFVKQHIVIVKDTKNEAKKRDF